MQIKNEHLILQVSAEGAELTSIVRAGRELLWQANPVFWRRHSPVLFPIVGSVWNGVYRDRGEEYALSQHGFARDMTFRMVEHTYSMVRFRLESNEETLRRYPYPFRLDIVYRLHANVIDVEWEVTNTGTREMPFQIGAHPAFYWPLLNDTARPDIDCHSVPISGLLGYFRFSRRIEKDGRTVHIPVTDLTRSVITEKGCVDPTQKLPVEVRHTGVLPLAFDLFEKDAMILEGCQVDRVELLSSAERPYLTLDFDAPLVGLWSPPGQHAPFVCIEPWYGRCDRVGYEGEFCDRDYVCRLMPGAMQHMAYHITVA